jgi:hypothetical protein
MSFVISPDTPDGGQQPETPTTGRFKVSADTLQPILGGKSWDETHQPTAPANHPYLAMAARLAGGVGSGIAQTADVITAGGLGIPEAAGGLIAGAGEAAAEGFEGSSLDPKRIGTEAALGAVPLGWIFKGGKALETAARSGIYNAVGTAGRQLAAGEPLDPTAIATQGGIGAITGGALSRFFGGAKAPTDAAAIKAPLALEDTIRSGAGTRVAGTPNKLGGIAEKGSFATPNARNITFPDSGNTFPPESIESHAYMDGDKIATMAPKGTPPLSVEDIQNLGPSIDPATGAPYRDILGDASTRVGKLRAAELATEAKTARLADKQKVIDDTNAAAAQEIENAKAEGAIRTPGTPTESFRNPIEGGTEQVTYGYKKPKPVKEAASSTSPLAKVLTPRPTTPPDFVPPGLGPKVPSKPTAMSIGGQPLDPELVKQLQKTYPDLMKTLGGTAAPEVTSVGVKSVENIAERPVQPVEPTPQPVEQAPAIPPTLAEAQSPLAKFFKSPVDAVGDAYRGIKGETDVNPLAKQQLGVALQTEAAKAGLPTRGTPNLAKFLSEKVSPDITAQQGGVPPVAAATEAAPTLPSTSEPAPYEPSNVTQDPNVHSMTQQEINDQLDLIDKAKADPSLLRLLLSGESPLRGSVGAAAANDPAVFENSGGRMAALANKLPATLQDYLRPGLGSRLAYGAVGSIPGAALGSTINPDDPTAGAIAGGAGGFLAGFAGRSGFQEGLEKGGTAAAGRHGAVNEAINYRNSGFLASPSAQGKKGIADFGNVLGKAAELMASKDAEERAMGLKVLKNILRPGENFKNLKEGWKSPELARQAVGSQNIGETPMPTGPLGWVTKPFAAQQNMWARIMTDAGVTPQDAEQALMVNKPGRIVPLIKKFMDMQNTPGYSGQAIRGLMPFMRIAMNRFEGGLERIPGISQAVGEDSSKLPRTLFGAGAVGVGMGLGAYDNANEDAGDPTSPIIKGLRIAGAGMYGLPLAVGEALTSHSARDIYNQIPGIRATVEPPNPNDNALQWIQKLLAQGLDEFIPNILSTVQSTSGKNATR